MENSDDIQTVNHRPVPWTGLDVVLLFLFWAVLVSASARTVFDLGGIAPDSPVSSSAGPAAGDKTPTVEHQLSQLLRAGRESPIILFVAFFSAVLAAPLAEEFFYRLILQGWLEKAVAPLRDVDPMLAPLFRPGVFSILFASTLFALAHGGTRVERPVDFLFCGLLGVGIGNILSVLFAAVYLVFLRQARLRDLGWSLKEFRSDAQWGGLAFLVTVPSVWGVHIFVKTCFPETVTDPVPIFLLSVILGTLFYRTGRVLPCIVLHALFNGFSFFLAVIGA